MPKIYFRNEATGKKFQVVKLDKESGKVTLRGEHAEFVEAYDRDRFKRLGYVLEKEESADAQ
jgi:glutamine amidotransferase-like uncharacterized protein